jgi:hypothetical protein
MTGQFRSGRSHAGDDRADDGGTHHAVDSQGFQQRLEGQCAHRRQGRGLAADGARLGELQTVRIHVDKGRWRRIGRLWGGTGRLHSTALGHQSGKALLGASLHTFHDRRRHQPLLPAEQLLDTRAHLRPALLGERELAAQVEQRDLPHLAADPAALHQAVGNVGFARRAVAGRGGTDKHAARVTQNPRQKPPSNTIMALHLGQKLQVK